MPIEGHFVRPDLTRLRGVLTRREGFAAAAPAALPAALSSVGLLGALTLGALSSVALPMAGAHTQVAEASFGFTAPARPHVISAPRPAATAQARASRSVARTIQVPVTKMVKVTGAPESGIASWYGAAFAGRRTSSGETFDPSQMTAAHKWLPFGTHVRVCTTYGRCAIVRITDRGPYVPGRIIDLSYAAAQSLGIGGLAQVTITPIETVTTYVAQTTYVTQTVAAPVAQKAAPRASRSQVRTHVAAAGERVPVRTLGSIPSKRVDVVVRPAGSGALSETPLVALAPLTTLAAFGACRDKFRLDLDEALELPAEQ